LSFHRTVTQHAGHRKTAKATFSNDLVKTDSRTT
jgi:hypothetical protein